MEVVPHRPDIMLEGIEIFRDHYVLLERAQGLAQLRVTDVRHRRDAPRSTFPEPAYSVFTVGNREFDTTPAALQLPVAGHAERRPMTTTWPPAKRTLLKQQPVLGRIRSAQYQSERLLATARDGTQVPVSIVYRRGLVRDGSDARCSCTATARTATRCR